MTLKIRASLLTTFLASFGVISSISAADLPFNVHTAQYQSYPTFQTFDATVEAVRRATVSSETSGRISEINFDVDDFVEKGSVLVRITDAATRARLSGLEANVSEAEAQYNVALSEFNRIKGVYERQLVSKSAFDRAEAELKAATQRLSAAQAKVKETLEQLKYTVVKAPYSGIVSERHVELGEMAKVGQPLLTGFSLSELRAVTHVPQSVVTQIRSAKEAQIIVDTPGQAPLRSSLITVYPEADPETQGPWLIGDYNVYGTNDYLLPIPKTWSESYAPGMDIGSGRFRDGGWGGQGPSLIVYNPGDPEKPPARSESLESLTLLLYAETGASELTDPSLRMDDYHHSDEWSGAAWLIAGDRTAVIFAGTKGIGDCWYGFANGVVCPDDPPYPEVPDPPYDDRGWWSTSFEGQLLFYDPNDFSDVALGQTLPHEPQPYAIFDIDPFLYSIHSSQQKHHLGAAAFDPENGHLFLLEPLVDEDKPIVHVWTVAS